MTEGRVQMGPGGHWKTEMSSRGKSGIPKLLLGKRPLGDLAAWALSGSESVSFRLPGTSAAPVLWTSRQGSVRIGQKDLAKA